MGFTFLLFFFHFIFYKMNPMMGGGMDPHMMQMMEEMQNQSSIQMINGLVSRCFNDCVSTMHSKKLSHKEEQCVHTCSDKFLKYFQRVNEVFMQESQQQQQEKFQQQMMAQQQQQMQQAGQQRLMPMPMQGQQ